MVAKIYTSDSPALFENMAMSMPIAPKIGELSLLPNDILLPSLNDESQINEYLELCKQNSIAPFTYLDLVYSSSKEKFFPKLNIDHNTISTHLTSDQSEYLPELLILGSPAYIQIEYQHVAKPHIAYSKIKNLYNGCKNKYHIESGNFVFDWGDHQSQIVGSLDMNHNEKYSAKFWFSTIGKDSDNIENILSNWYG